MPGASALPLPGWSPAPPSKPARHLSPPALAPHPNRCRARPTPARAVSSGSRERSFFPAANLPAACPPSYGFGSFILSSVITISNCPRMVACTLYTKQLYC